MADLIIHNGLADRLRKAARQHNLSVDAFLETLLERSGSAGDVPPSTAAAQTGSAVRADIQAPDPDDEDLTRWGNEGGQ